MNQQPCVYVIGPTASGKSDLAIELAKRWQGEVVNADSMQIRWTAEPGRNMSWR